MFQELMCSLVHRLIVDNDQLDVRVIGFRAEAAHALFEQIDSIAAAGVLVKPFNMTELVAAVTHALQPTHSLSSHAGRLDESRSQAPPGSDRAE